MNTMQIVKNWIDWNTVGKAVCPIEHILIKDNIKKFALEL